jgi:indole-3-acetate monooxygenase
MEVFMTDSTFLDGPAILANAKALEPLLREEADKAECCRQLTPRIVEALRTAGVFRMPIPTTWGGPQVEILSQIEIVEAISRAYGSAGWCAMIGSDSGFFSASLDDRIGGLPRALAGQPREDYYCPARPGPGTLLLAAPL